MDETTLKAQLAVMKAKALMIKVASRWPSGAPQGKGGQFAPKTVAGGSGSKSPAKMFYTPPPANTFESKGWDGSGMWGKPSTPPPGAKPHPQMNDQGKPVSINYPTKASHASTWSDSAKTATFVPGGDTPDTLNGVAMKPWNPSKDGWGKAGGTDESLDADFPFEAHKTKSTGAGVLILEDDGRVWLTAPTNAFGGYKNTYPKGTAESGLTLQQNAIKEAYEETGLKIQIIDVLGDYERDTSKARMYVARRVGGTPKNMGWESQAIRLAPLKDAKVLLNKPHDKEILDDLSNIMGIRKVVAPKPSAGAWNRQPRWPAKTALGGQWKTSSADGITQAPAIAGGLSGKNAIYQKVANAAFSAAQSGDLTAVQAAIDKYQGAATKYAAGVKSSSHVKWGAQVHQFATQAASDVTSKTKASASAAAIKGPVKLTEFKQVGAKPGGSNPGALYQHPDEPNSTYLVKGNKQLQGGAVTLAVSDDRAKNEVLSSKLLLAAGVGAPTMGLVDLEGQHGGGLGVASLMVAGAAAFNPNNAAHVSAAQADFAVNAWLANYDVLGMGFDNTVIKDGKAINIDPGGALLFRAQGQPKGLMHGVVNGVLDATAPEFESMRVTTTEQMKVFGSMTKDQLATSAQKLAQIDDATINKLVNTYGPGDQKAKAALAINLIARRDAILAKTGIKVTAAMAQPIAPEAPKAADPAKTAAIKEQAKQTVDKLQAEGKSIVGNIKAAQYKVASPMLSNNASDSSKTLATAIHMAAQKQDLDGLGLVAATAKMNLAMAKQGGDKNQINDASELWANATDNIANVKANIEANAKKIAESTPDYISVLFAGGNNKPQYKAKSPGILTFYGDLTDQAGLLHASGDLAGLKAMALHPKNGFYLTKHDSGNSKLLQSYYSGLVQSLEESQAATVVATAQAAQKAISEPVANPPKPKEAKAPNPAMPDFEKAKLPSANSNAASHNPKVELIAALAAKGDAAGIAALAYGTNTYGKKQAAIANSALAAIGSSLNVAAGQKKNANTALYGGATSATLAAAEVKIGVNVKRPAPTKKGKPITIDEGKFPTMPTFVTANLVVKAENENHAKAIEFLGKSGDLAGLKSYDKFSQKSQKLTEYKQGLIESLEQQLFPPRGKTGLVKNAPPIKPEKTPLQSLAKHADNFQPVKVTEAFKVVAHHKVAGWVLLGNTDASTLKQAFANGWSGAPLSSSLVAKHTEVATNASASDKANISKYVGNWSYGANDQMRNKGQIDKDVRAVSETVHRMAQELPEGTVLKRNLNLKGAGLDMLKAAQAGDIIQSPQFESTANPTGKYGEGKNVRLNLITTPGVKGIYVGKKLGLGGEDEMILPENTRYAIHRVYQKGDITIVEAVILPTVKGQLE